MATTAHPHYPGPRRSAILTGRISSRAELFHALDVAAGMDFPTIKNLDAMADALRQARAAGLRVVKSPHWQLPLADTVLIAEIFRDCGVDLHLVAPN